jgi:hypothetical protein
LMLAIERIRNVGEAGKPGQRQFPEPHAEGLRVSYPSMHQMNHPAGIKHLSTESTSIGGHP